MGHRVLAAADVDWRVSRALGVRNADLAGQLDAPGLSARMWRLAPGDFLACHSHREETELYVVLEGTGRLRVGEESLTLAPHSAVVVEPATVRQVFNDTDADALWLIVGTPPEAAADYPGELTAPPPELA